MGLLSPAWIAAIGWVLLHFVWQGAAVALLFLVSRLVMRRATAASRYAAGCAALAILAACPVVTAAVIAWQPAVPGAVPGALRAARQPALPGQRSSSSPQLSVDTPQPAALPGDVAEDPLRDSSGAVAPPARGLLPPPPRNAAFAVSTPAGPLWRARLEAAFPWIVAGWLVGVPLLALRLVLGWSQALRWGRRGVQTVGDPLARAVADLSRRMNLRRSVAVFRSALVDVPMVVGWLRPVILLPAAALTGLSTAQLEAIIAHELAHIRRHDAIVNVFQCLLETLLFYHPAVWWISAVVRQEREQCCDDQVLRLGLDPVQYAAALLGLEEARAGDPRNCRRTARRLALAASGGKLLTRVRRILAVPQPPESRAATWLTAGVAVFIVAAVLVASGLVEGQTPADKTAPGAAAGAATKPTAKTIAVPTADQRVMAKLREPNPVNFDANKLASVIDYFKNTTGLDFEVRWAQLQAAGVLPDTPVTLQYASVRTDRALRRILEGLPDNPAATNRLDFTIIHARLVISTHADLLAPANLDVHVYDVRDLGPRLAGPVGDDAGRTPISGLMTAIADNVGNPSEWREHNNLATFTIDPFKDTLLVRTSTYNHAAIEELLTLLRQCAAAGPAPVPDPVDPQGDAAALKALQKQMPINFDRNKLSSVIDYFRNTTGLDIDPSWAHLHAAGVEQSTPVTGQFASIPVADGLRSILDGISPVGAERWHVGYVVSNGAVAISTYEDLHAPERLELRAYDTRALLLDGARRTAGKPTDTTDPAKLKELTTRIANNVGVPDDWRDLTHGTSTITEFGGWLLVRTTGQNHRVLRDLLARLRQAAAASPGAPTNSVVTPRSSADPGAPNTGVFQGGAHSNDPVVPTGVAPSAAGTPRPDVDSEADRQAFARLATPYTAALTSSKVGAALDALKGATNLDLDVQWPRLAEAGVEPDTPLTARFDALPAYRALTSMLDGLSPVNSPQEHVEFAVVDGTVRVSTYGDLHASQYLQRRAYDIRGMSPMFADAGDTPASPPATDRVMQLIFDVVGTGADWSARGSGTSTIDPFGNNLLVRTTRRNHAQIAALLSAIRNYPETVVWRSEDNPMGDPRSNPAGWARAADSPEAINIDRAATFRPQQRLTVTFNATKFSEVLETVSRSINMPIQANWARLSDAGVERDTPVSTQWTHAPADKVLTSTLAGLSPANDVRNRLEYIAVDGALLVSTHDDLGLPAHLSIRVYDVSDLLTPAAAKALAAPAAKAGQPIDSLKDLIYRNVGVNEDWRERANGYSDIKPFAGRLIIKATAANHQAVREFLAVLRDAKPDHDATPAPPPAERRRNLLFEQHREEAAPATQPGAEATPDAGTRAALSAANEPPSPDRLTTIEYSIGDLVRGTAARAPIGDAEQIAGSIRARVAPKHWRPADPGGGTIQTEPDKLIINTTDANHEAIASLLKDTREGVQLDLTMRVFVVDAATCQKVWRLNESPDRQASARQPAFDSVSARYLDGPQAAAMDTALTGAGGASLRDDSAILRSGRHSTWAIFDAGQLASHPLLADAMASLRINPSLTSDRRYAILALQIELNGVAAGAGKGRPGLDTIVTVPMDGWLALAFPIVSDAAAMAPASSPAASPKFMVVLLRPSDVRPSANQGPPATQPAGDAERRRRQAQAETQEEVQRLLRRAADLRHEQNYDKSLEVINQAVFFDPDNVAAQAMKEMVEDSLLYAHVRERERQRDLLYSQHRVEDAPATRPAQP